jgi:hypothetical protein
MRRPLYESRYLSAESDFHNFESHVENTESRHREFFRFEINRYKLKHIICVRCDVTVQTPNPPLLLEIRDSLGFRCGQGQFILIEGDGY